MNAPAAILGGVRTGTGSDEAGDPALPPGVAVMGGAGGTAAHLADLEATAVGLDAAADALDAAASAVARVVVLVDSTTRWSPGTAARARADLAPLVSAWSGVAARAAQARSAAARLRSTAGVYRDTDSLVAAVVRNGLATVGGALGDAGPIGWITAGALVVAGALQAGLSLVTVRTLRYSPGLVGVALRALGSAENRAAPGALGMMARTVGGPGLLPQGLGFPSARTVEILMPGAAGFIRGMAPWPYIGGARLAVPQAAGTLLVASKGATALFGTPRPGLVVAPVITGPRPPGRPSESLEPPTPRNVSDVLDQIWALSPLEREVGPPPGEAGSVGVQQLDHADGTRSWVVTVPGTQDWSPIAGSNPVDLTTNLEVAAGVRDDASEVVRQAMDQAGIAPGEPVLLAGHSQGGMIAMGLAEEPEMLARYSIEAVVTAGAPITSGELPPQVQALNIEHVQDYVPTADSGEGRDQPNRTTVVVDLTKSASPENRAAAGSPSTAHGPEVYSRTAEEIEDLDDPSLRAAQEAIRGVLGDGTAQATLHRYVGMRVEECR